MTNEKRAEIPELSRLRLSGTTLAQTAESVARLALALRGCDGAGVQMLGGPGLDPSVGTDAQPYFRVFNPVTQGRRFDPDTTTHGVGLTHMTDRTDAAGGNLAITSSPGHGTTITLTLPVPTGRSR